MCGIPFICTAENVRISPQVLFGINIKHPPAGGFRTEVFAVVYMSAFLVALSYSHFILRHTMVGRTQRRCDLPTSYFITRAGLFGQQRRPSWFRVQSASGKAILLFRGMYAFSMEVSWRRYLYISMKSKAALHRKVLGLMSGCLFKKSFSTRISAYVLARLLASTGK